MAAPEFPAAVRPVPPDVRPRRGPGRAPDGTAPPPALNLDDRQRKLISLLYAGHTDASAAHRLGISPRTVTNILRSLMDRLGVDNRFQLGMALGSRLRLPDRNGMPPTAVRPPMPGGPQPLRRPLPPPGPGRPLGAARPPGSVIPGRSAPAAARPQRELPQQRTGRVEPWSRG